jgi:hypothetical protein
MPTEDTIHRHMNGVAVAGISLLFVALGSVASGQSQAGTPDAKASRPLSVAIIGASVSAGFVDGPLSGGDPSNKTVPLQQIMRGWLREVGGRVRSVADLLFFQDPDKSGVQQVERAVAADPDVVLAVDFLFWFAYGGFVEIDDEGEESARMRRLERGLKALDELSCDVVLGDLPDMQGASARLIRPSQIPAPELLEKMNARIRAWAKERKRVHLFELGSLVRRMKTEGVVLELAGGALQVPPAGMLQGDRLHANRLGMAYLGSLLQARLGSILAGRKLPDWVLDDFVELARADDDVDSIRAGLENARDR